VVDDLATSMVKDSQGNFYVGGSIAFGPAPGESVGGFGNTDEFVAKLE
jgi:hypothetical protein